MRHARERGGCDSAHDDTTTNGANRGGGLDRVGQMIALFYYYCYCMSNLFSSAPVLCTHSLVVCTICFWVWVAVLFIKGAPAEMML